VDTVLFKQKESEMAKQRGAYTAQFRQQLVELVDTGRSSSDVGRQFGVHPTTVAYWVRVSRPGKAVAPSLADGKPASGPLDSAERQELMELRRKYRQVQMERDILAKATAWFANNSEQTYIPSTR
jgi:transposase